MGNTQSTSFFFQRALESFILSNPFLQKKEFTRRAFIAALIYLFHLSKSTPESYKRDWEKRLGDFVKHIYDVRAEVETFLKLLKTQAKLTKLFQNRIFSLIMDRCRDNPTFSLSCWDSKTSSWSHQNVDIFFRSFSYVLINVIFPDFFDGSVALPHLFVPEIFDDNFYIKHEDQHDEEYKFDDQRLTLISMIQTTIESIIARLDFPEERKQSSSFLSASNGEKIYVYKWFVRELEQHWIDLLLDCSRNALPITFNKEALRKWGNGERIVQ